ncbi:MAG TPA: malonyl-CoA decarboxylase [Rickettsiales bacterium]|nr:malonyl-CoA decarboxylase [Rickettsiales bacterium]
MAKTAETKPSATLANFRRKAVVGVLRKWREISGSARLAITGEVHPTLPKEDLEHLRRQMSSYLDNRGGEITARAQTVELGKTYLSLTEAGRLRFLNMLADDFDLDRAHLDKCIEALKNAKDKKDTSKLENDLREALITPRSKILKHFNSLPDGFKFLVDMRADLLQFSRKSPNLKGLEYDLKQILSAWFDIGLLDLVEINWQSSAAVLEKLIAYEAVHKVRSWEDLKNRLDADRRVYGFFHNKMPHEPLIFVHVALTKGLAGSVQEILDEKSPLMDIDGADTAIFYSISNAQKGLTGISFGNFLIKRVVDKLTREMKQIRHFSTLSPIPNFRTWLDPLLHKGDESIFNTKEVKELRLLTKNTNAANGLAHLLESDWRQDAATAEKLHPILIRLAAHYVLNEKNKRYALDPVAHFHLTNGARVKRLNWLGDTSPKGMKQSAGMMVNYYYNLEKIDDNHEDYVTDGNIDASRTVKALL